MGNVIASVIGTILIICSFVGLAVAVIENNK